MRRHDQLLSVSNGEVNFGSSKLDSRQKTHFSLIICLFWLMWQTFLLSFIYFLFLINHTIILLLLLLYNKKIKLVDNFFFFFFYYFFLVRSCKLSEEKCQKRVNENYFNYQNPILVYQLTNILFLTSLTIFLHVFLDCIVILLLFDF